MAKYSREQRDRAVDLYIKYERCAADVIRELGYPSKGVLLSWYADRLEEERTGVPSGRGERYRRYTDGQKRAAVDHYLEYGRRPGRTMRMLGYPKSKELLMAWIDELAPGQRKLRHGPVPEELKREAVVAVASGRLKSREAAAEPRIQLVSATAGFGSACFDCSLAISSSHTSLGVLYPRSFMGVSLISPTIASSSSCVRSSKLVPLGR